MSVGQPQCDHVLRHVGADVNSVEFSIFRKAQHMFTGLRLSIFKVFKVFEVPR